MRKFIALLVCLSLLCSPCFASKNSINVDREYLKYPLLFLSTVAIVYGAGAVKEKTAASSFCGMTTIGLGMLGLNYVILEW